MKRAYKDHLASIRDSIDSHLEFLYEKPVKFHIEDVSGLGEIKDGVLFADGERAIYDTEQQIYIDASREILSMNQVENMPAIPYQTDKDDILELIKSEFENSEIQAVQDIIEPLIESEGEGITL